MIEMLIAGAKAAGSIYSGFANAQASRTNAKLNNRAAAAAREQAALDEARTRQGARAIAGKNRANIASNGMTLDGSALDVMESNAVQSELDALLVRYQGQMKAYGYETQAKLDNARARNEIIGGFLQAGGQLIESRNPGYTTEGNSLNSGWYSTQQEADAAAARNGITWIK